MKKILVANRGEIALRVMRSAREMGIATVAVFSEADRLMPFVQYADQAVGIGPAPSAQSYLRGEEIIRVASQFQVDAIHPGYGFLSENAHFAQMVEDAGCIFIGPSPATIGLMGNKLAAKQAALQLGIPLVPGMQIPLKHSREALEMVKTMGYPFLIKAAGGGGGKGMRIVEQDSDLESQIQQAKNEAQHAFGDDTLFIEKYLPSPRHIEIQVLGDQYGNYVYLFERECSIQRRHQKLIEEAPSCCLTSELRQAMGQCAVELARGCGYRGVGTVEFLLDEKGQFYFLEMNTRIQVEHPVTELITGIDLIKEQIRVARGERLSFTQGDVHIHGHALELRVCAEDPAHEFLPETGHLDLYIRPQGIGVRVDDGYEQGQNIPVYYDSMIAKLVVWGKDRSEAIERMIRAIDEFQITGVKTTLPFGRWAFHHPAFISGNLDTHFIEKYFSPEQMEQPRKEDERVAAMLALELQSRTSSGGLSTTHFQTSSPRDGWRKRNRT
ncbi:MAG: acetyl-CoA carboxylase biotin carboxylase subunit [Chitinophagaceae bacterium]